MKWDTGMNGHHGFFFTPNFGSPFCFSASSPNIQYSSIVHLLTAFSWSCVKVHCICMVHSMHQCPDMDSLPNTMARNAKSPVTCTSTFGIVSTACSVVRHVWLLNLHRMFPCSSLYVEGICCHDQESSGKTWQYCWINFAVSFLHINSHADTLNSIMYPSQSLTDTDAPNWKAVLPWSPPTTTWTLRTLDGFTLLLISWHCKYRAISSSMLFSVHSINSVCVLPQRWSQYCRNARLHDLQRAWSRFFELDRCPARGEHEDVSSFLVQ